MEADQFRIKKISDIVKSLVQLARFNKRAKIFLVKNYSKGVIFGKKYLIEGTTTRAAKNKTIKQPKISPIKQFLKKSVALIISKSCPFETIYEDTKNEMSVLNNAVKIAKKIRW